MGYNLDLMVYNLYNGSPTLVINRTSPLLTISSSESWVINQMLNGQSWMIWAKNQPRPTVGNHNESFLTTGSTAILIKHTSG